MAESYGILRILKTYKLISPEQEKNVIEESKKDSKPVISTIVDMKLVPPEKIREILTEKKVRNISDKKYQELFDYIEQNEKPKKIIVINHNNLSDSENEEEDKIDKKEEPISKMNNYVGYINQIKELKKKVFEDDFLQIHEPLPIEGESIYNSEAKNEFNLREKKIKNLYNNVVLDLRKKESLAFNTEAWLVCTLCYKEICPIKKENPICTNEKVGEYRLFGPWLKENLKSINDKKKPSKKKDDNKKDEKKEKILYDPNEKILFEENLKKENIEFDSLFTCPSRKHIIGYVRKGERYIYYESNLTVKYPDLSYEKIDGHDYFLNKFKDVHEKVDEIQEMKKTDDFKEKIFCKLCEFHVKDYLKEFKELLDYEVHKDKIIGKGSFGLVGKRHSSKFVS